MRKLPILVTTVAVLLASAAQSAPSGCNLRWDHCYGEGGVPNKGFACDTNSGGETMLGSFVMLTDMEDAHGVLANVDFATASATVPGWWQFQNAGTCRSTSLTAGGSLLAPPPPTNCPDWAQGGASGALATTTFNANGYGANTVGLLIAFAYPASVVNPLSGHQEYFAFGLNLDHVRTVGAGACAGCATPVCIVVNRIEVFTGGVTGSRALSGPANGTDSDYVTWLGGAGMTTSLGSGCPAAAPVKRSTWSSVKSLYR